MNLLAKIQALKDRFLGRGDPQDISVIFGWEEEAKRLFLLQSLKEHSGIKYVLEIFRGEVEKINDQLLNKRQMFEDERYRLLDQRALAQKYLNLFEIDNQLEQLEVMVDKE